MISSPLGDLRVLETVSQPSYGENEAVHLAFRPEDTLLFDTASERHLPGVQAALV